MNKSVFTVLLLCLTIFAIQAFNPQQPRYKNLQILPQDITKGGLDSVMRHFARSLGVKCGYCHVKNEETNKMDFASDDKTEKHIARGMMAMAIDINKNHFAPHDESDREYLARTKDTSSARYLLKYATCYTCHHGDTRPVNRPPDDKN